MKNEKGYISLIPLLFAIGLGVIVVISAMLLYGCSSTPAAEPPNALIKEHSDLKAEYEVVLQEKKKLASTSADLTDLRNVHNKLVNDYHTLQTKYTILEAYYETATAQYTSLIEQFASSYTGNREDIKELSQEYARAVWRLNELKIHIDAVHDEEVPLLSANLTVEEYDAFYKGWELWWNEFNDEDEED